MDILQERTLAKIYGTSHRLVIGNVFIVQGGYEEWEDYRKACSTLEGDQEFVQLWEKLLSNTKVCMM